MAKVHIWLKWSFIVVTSVIATINAILLVCVMIAHGFFPDVKEFSSDLKYIHLLYIFIIIPLVLVIFGLVGVCKKKKWAVLVFTVGMILMSLILFPVAVYGLGNKSEIADELRTEYLDYGPLSETSAGFQEEMHDQQKKFQCCGMARGYSDWGEDIPPSCECFGHPLTNPCVELQTTDDKVFMVYEKPCLPYLVEEEMQMAEAIIGVMMALVVLWMLSVVLSIVILCKLFKKEHSPGVVYHSGVL